MNKEKYTEIINKMSEGMTSLDPFMQEFLKNNYETQGFNELELAIYFQIYANIYTNKTLRQYKGLTKDDLKAKAVEALESYDWDSNTLQETLIESSNLAYVTLGMLHIQLSELEEND